jgi:hypothetical protein
MATTSTPRLDLLHRQHPEIGSLVPVIGLGSAPGVPRIGTGIDIDKLLNRTDRVRRAVERQPEQRFRRSRRHQSQQWQQQPEPAGLAGSKGGLKGEAVENPPKGV